MALAASRAALERERARGAAAEAQARESGALCDSLASLEHDVAKATAVAVEAQQAVAARKEAARVLKAARARVADDDAEALRLAAEAEHLRRSLLQLAERQTRLEQQGELKVRAREGPWGCL